MLNSDGKSYTIFVRLSTLFSPHNKVSGPVQQQWRRRRRWPAKEGGPDEGIPRFRPPQHVRGGSREGGHPRGRSLLARKPVPRRKTLSSADEVRESCWLKANTPHAHYAIGSLCSVRVPHHDHDQYRCVLVSVPCVCRGQSCCAPDQIAYCCVCLPKYGNTYFPQASGVIHWAGIEDLPLLLLLPSTYSLYRRGRQQYSMERQ